jgi:uncharacterized glyoxalase superfamily protein PhnB
MVLPYTPLSNFALVRITLKVKSARKTHQFLCEAFAQPNTLNPWDPLIQQKGGLPQLAQDGMHTDFQMCNATIRFSTATSPQHAAGGDRITIEVHVKDVKHVKRVCNGQKWKYKLGHEAELGRQNLKWIEIRRYYGWTPLAYQWCEG